MEKIETSHQLMIRILDYEVRSSWWAGWLPGECINELSARYFAWKVRGKFARYMKSEKIRNKLILTGKL